MVVEVVLDEIGGKENGAHSSLISSNWYPSSVHPCLYALMKAWKEVLALGLSLTRQISLRHLHCLSLLSVHSW